MASFRYFLITVLLFCCPIGFCVAMSSANYQINWDSVNVGGTDTASSANYQILDTVGQTEASQSNSANYQLKAGYRQSDEELPMITAVLKTQANSSQVTYTLFNNVGLAVTVSSATGYSVGDYIAVVEDFGGSQKTAVGKISSIDTLTIYVDKWSGDNGSMSTSPTGGDDYVYELLGSSGSFGTLSTGLIKTTITAIEVTTNAQTGYTAKASADGKLRTSTDDINDVTDGTVTVGSEEYGISTTGDDAYGSGDFALTSSTQVMSKASAANTSRTSVVYQAAVSTTTPSGQYSQVVTYTVTGNF